MPQWPTPYLSSLHKISFQLFPQPFIWDLCFHIGYGRHLM
ncbi:hypothetical protein ERO13_D06G113001v2 [Gossypium hirsutum]|uniref:Uncharacterized protein n=1 Tax=Gossypium darwinii TaxID=34276 RepID=A0A5D2C9R9_GOSDA|nr:hypothetical protein ERO13_D06G113001v2 [Gossypium hirsutum]TYG64842.1 hypothetical protein ES288_D06G139200v1 [Gossypium darwinii]